ncbi:MAG TPA: transposase family protein [Microcoleus sp.]|nr:transposase family protein [Microcoleus sp.]
MKRLMTNILNSHGVIVENQIQTAETLIFTVKLSKKTAICPRCGQTSHRLHQNQGHLVRDGSISMKATKLEIGVLRQEALLLRGRRKEEEGRRQKKYFYKYEMLPDA